MQSEIGNSFRLRESCEDTAKYTVCINWELNFNMECLLGVDTKACSWSKGSCWIIECAYAVSTIANTTPPSVTDSIRWACRVEAEFTSRTCACVWTATMRWNTNSMRVALEDIHFRTPSTCVWVLQEKLVWWEHDGNEWTVLPRSWHRNNLVAHPCLLDTGRRYSRNQLRLCWRQRKTSCPKDRTTPNRWVWAAACWHHWEGQCGCLC